MYCSLVVAFTNGEGVDVFQVQLLNTVQRVHHGKTIWRQMHICKCYWHLSFNLRLSQKTMAKFQNLQSLKNLVGKHALMHISCTVQAAKECPHTLCNQKKKSQR